MSVLTVLTVLSVMSCSSQRTVQTASSQESVRVLSRDSTLEELRTLTAQPVPPDTVRLTLSLDSLSRLPEGAEFRNRGSRTEVSVRHGPQPGTIQITAASDSLTRLMEQYRSMVRSYNYALDSMTRVRETESVAVKKPPDSVWIYVLCFTTGGLTVILLKLKEKKNNG